VPEIEVSSDGLILPRRCADQNGAGEVIGASAFPGYCRERPRRCHGRRGSGFIRSVHSALTLKQ
jgi:hypothetical protein